MPLICHFGILFLFIYILVLAFSLDLHISSYIHIFDISFSNYVQSLSKFLPSISRFFFIAPLIISSSYFYLLSILSTFLGFLKGFILSFYKIMYFYIGRFSHYPSRATGYKIAYIVYVTIVWDKIDNFCNLEAVNRRFYYSKLYV